MKTTKQEIEKIVSKNLCTYINGDLYRNYKAMPGHAIYHLNKPLNKVTVFIVEII